MPSYANDFVNSDRKNASATSMLPVKSEDCSSIVTRNKNCIHIEMFGACLFYSINYERLLSHWFTLKFGGSYLEPKIQLFNLSTNFLFNIYNDNYEFGIGLTYNTDKNNFIKSNFLQTTSLGLRNDLFKNYFTTRIGLMTIWNIDYNKFFPYLYGSIGYYF